MGSVTVNYLPVKQPEDRWFMVDLRSTNSGPQHSPRWTEFEDIKH
jgi:hypothetical protein